MYLTTGAEQYWESVSLQSLGGMVVLSTCNKKVLSLIPGQGGQGFFLYRIRLCVGFHHVFQFSPMVLTRWMQTGVAKLSLGVIVGVIYCDLSVIDQDVNKTQ